MTGLKRNIRTSSPGKQAGFTLLEVVCAIGIAAAIMAAIMGCLSVTIRILQQAREVMRTNRVANGIERIMRRDLESAAALNEEGYRALAGFNPGAGLMEANQDKPFLEFFSTNSYAPLSRRPGTGLTRIEYLFRLPDESERGYDLLRTETPYFIGKPLDRSASLTERLAGGIAVWRVGFYDGTEWQDEWRRESLPQALRVSFALGQEEDGIERTETLLFAPAVDRGENPMPGN